MKAIDLIQSVSFNNIRPLLDKKYNYCERLINELEEAYREIKAVRIKENNNYIIISQNPAIKTMDAFFVSYEDIKTTLRTTNNIDSTDKNSYKNPCSCQLVPWDVLFGMNVYTKKENNLSAVKMATAIVIEATWCGNNEEYVSKKIAEIKEACKFRNIDFTYTTYNEINEKISNTKIADRDIDIVDIGIFAHNYNNVYY